ncbi:hypothetical protein B0I35DRAFT_480154 [Stachybotrys elegans]|uniref:Uncharacterized protein n=1 Tax=Stachybotrys elegans TaxID=80388 RepID=A0A8K0WQ88_9HYPO|nr:hypothetical protein B0I35DRAFT_480154 [Stachybotrys elegans]
MLRRPPTTLQITSEDLAAVAVYAHAQPGDAHTGPEAHSMEGVQSSPDPHVRVRRARDDRIGVSSTRRGGR